MGKTRQATQVGEKLDPNNLPGSVAFWIRLSDRHDGVVLMPRVLPDSYRQSVNYLVRLGVAVLNPASFDDPLIVPATEKEVAQFMVKEYKTERETVSAGQDYTNRYDTVVRLAESALSRDLPEQGAAPLADVIDISTRRIAGDTYSSTPESTVLQVEQPHQAS